jgi:hypothetical protein
MGGLIVQHRELEVRTVEGQAIEPRGHVKWLATVVLVSIAGFAGCGEEGPLPTTVDPGPDFNVSEVVFDENYFYCRIEPMIFNRGCGPGDPSQGDPANGCHYNVTSYRLTDYAPLLGDNCDGLVPQTNIPPAARQNYQLSQARMKRDPELAPLLTRPTGKTVHPRTIFEPTSAEADLIRQWANQFSSQ